MSTLSSREAALTPAAVETFYQELEAALPLAEGSEDAWVVCFRRWNDFKCRVSGEAARRRYREAQDTRDEAVAEALRNFRETILPPFEAGNARIRAFFLESPVRPALESLLGRKLFADWELEQSSFSPENIALNTEESELCSRYHRLLGGSTLDCEGETITLTQATARLNVQDEGMRHAAWDAIATWTEIHHEALHGLYDDFVTLRTRMARNLGEANYVPLGYRRMGRTDYGPAEVAAFREEIKRHIVPVLARHREAQALTHGTPRVLPWNASYSPGLSMGAGAAPVEKQIAQGKELFKRMHPRLSAHYNRMVDQGLIDLENRPGKGPGAFCTSFDDEKKVAILCNSTGAESDVTTLIHEMGHAFQAWESIHLEPLEYRWPTMDAAEVHSMGMEFLTLKEITAFFSPEDARRYRQLKLLNTLRRIPYMATVDEFQHWVYENPEHSHEEREQAWARLWDTYNPGIDYTGESTHHRTRWMRQPHIFVLPFYYIDYAIAEVGAMQLWQMAEQDHGATMDRYLKLCAIGGSQSLEGIFAAGGLKLPFEQGVLEPLMKAVATELDL